MLYLVSVLSHSGGGTSFDGPWYDQLYRAIVDGIDFIIEGFNELLAYLEIIVSDLETMISYTGYFLARVPQYLGFLPSPVVSVLILGFSISVAYLIFDRK